ncbi:hypothetical protein BDP55DRAFT_337891 [Colletotrichum godetiae]|uniref:Uncharacterized protein n=1 Tax=Colletotrichum godetiae TaxID=1209918 RepID=A0AAJ0ABM7_9PEZI|nr:uncharacterized protein BDP55DRAFT_337891 [Colletotrichum godetiae]KAK1659543.1 hypothetical protein BDP55DRAFT_337891 [Colletotrichum godetiae]
MYVRDHNTLRLVLLCVVCSLSIANLNIVKYVSVCLMIYQDQKSSVCNKMNPLAVVIKGFEGCMVDLGRISAMICINYSRGPLEHKLFRLCGNRETATVKIGL